MSAKDHKNKEGDSSEEYEIEVVGQDYIDAIEKGVTPDNLNLKRLIFWLLSGLSVLVISAVIAANLFQYDSFSIRNQTSVESTQYQVTAKRKHVKQVLDSYGIINEQKGIYRIPIDSAMKYYVEENQNATK